jgi:hypothetical protein
MRPVIMTMLLAAAVVSASAQDLGNQAPAKPVATYPENIPNPILQGGDTFANATVIPDLPYNDSGTTVGYTNNYDAVCPYTGGTAPDVVYRYVATTTVWSAIDLCGSAYDTKLYVMDAAQTVLACNDDFYTGAPCGTYVSLIENFTFAAGNTYYIVVDGYGSASGSYVLSVGGWECCCVYHCPDDGQLEGEPPLVPNYVDNWNGGCNTPPGYPFQNVVGDDNGDAILCGVSGWYTSNGGNFRDTDWYILTMGAAGTIEITASANEDTYIFELGPQDCEAVGVIQSTTCPCCTDAFMTISGYEPGAPVWFWVGPTVFTPPNYWYEYAYMVWFNGLEAVVATQATTWSTVKALYD